MNASRWRDEPMCSSRAVLLGALIQLLCRLPRLSTWAWPGPCAAGDSARPAQGRMVWILGRPHSATRDRRSTGALAAISPASRRGAVNRIAPGIERLARETPPYSCHRDYAPGPSKAGVGAPQPAAPPVTQPRLVRQACLWKGKAREVRLRSSRCLCGRAVGVGPPRPRSCPGSRLLMAQPAHPWGVK